MLVASIATLVKLCSRDLAGILQILTLSLGKASPLTLLEPRQLHSSNLTVQTLLFQWPKKLFLREWLISLFTASYPAWKTTMGRMVALLDADIHPVLLERQFKFLCTHFWHVESFWLPVSKGLACTCVQCWVSWQKMPHFQTLCKESGLKFCLPDLVLMFPLLMAC